MCCFWYLPFGVVPGYVRFSPPCCSWFGVHCLTQQQRARLVKQRDTAIRMRRHGSRRDLFTTGDSNVVERRCRCPDCLHTGFILVVVISANLRCHVNPPLELFFGIP